MIDATGIADKEEYIEKCVAEYIALRTGNNLQRSDRYYTFRTERGHVFKTVTITGYAKQPEPGYRLDGNGTDGLFWSDSGGPEANGSVAFTFPVKQVTVTVTLGVAGFGGGVTGVYKQANQGPGNYKMKVSKTEEVEQVVIYQIDTRNGNETVWDDMYFKELKEVWPQIVKVS